MPLDVERKPLFLLYFFFSFYFPKPHTHTHSNSHFSHSHMHAYLSLVGTEHYFPAIPRLNAQFTATIYIHFLFLFLFSRVLVALNFLLHSIFFISAMSILYSHTEIGRYCFSSSMIQQAVRLERGNSISSL